MNNIGISHVSNGLPLFFAEFFCVKWDSTGQQLSPGEYFDKASLCNRAGNLLPEIRDWCDQLTVDCRPLTEAQFKDELFHLLKNEKSRLALSAVEVKNGRIELRFDHSNGRRMFATWNVQPGGMSATLKAETGNEKLSIHVNGGKLVVTSTSSIMMGDQCIFQHMNQYSLVPSTDRKVWLLADQKSGTFCQ